MYIQHYIIGRTRILEEMGHDMSRWSLMKRRDQMLIHEKATLECSLKCSYTKIIDTHVYVYNHIYVLIFIYTETSHSAYVDSTLWTMAGTPRTDGLPLRESSFRSEGLGFLKEKSPFRRWVFFPTEWGDLVLHMAFEGMIFDDDFLGQVLLMLCHWAKKMWSSWCLSILNLNDETWPQAASEGQHFSGHFSAADSKKIGCRQPFIIRKSSILPDSWDPSPRSDSSEDSVNLARLGSKYSKQIRENLKKPWSSSEMLLDFEV